MQDILSAHSAKVGWHILRTHRERNRIVNRANPSTNVSTLIVNLNEYILHIFDTFFELAEAQRARLKASPEAAYREIIASLG
jgi:hypothetical protein